MSMKQKSFYIYIAAYLAILIPLPGRFVFGLTLMFELFLLTVIGTLINSLIKTLKLKEIHSVILLTVLISFVILYRQLLIITYTEIAFTLGFYIYLPAVSLFLLYFLFDETQDSLLVNLKANTKKTFLFSLSGILFFLFRDIASYGTFTFFGTNHQIYEKILFNPEKIGIFSFFATIPGALILAGVILFVNIVFRKKFRIIKNAEIQNDVH